MAVSSQVRISGYETAQLWDFQNSQPISLPLQHAHSVTCASFSRDGKLLATGSRENTYTWDISAILKEAGPDELLSNPNVS
jgi:WD40 repeat protein